MNVANTSNFEESANHSLNENVSLKPTSKGFSGEVLCHDISQIIRSLSLAKLDIALVIKNGPKDGKIIFKGGKIMASICGDLRDREAVSEIKSWKEGSFTLFRIFDGIICRND